MSRPSRTRTLKRALASLVAVGALGSLSVSGTYAILTSEETNAGSTVSAGTLTFGNSVDGGATCYSYAGPSSPGNVNGSCSALLSSATQHYPGDTATSTVRIANNGSLDIADLGVYMPSCTSAATPGAGSNAGGGDPCSYITDGGGNPTGPYFSIQETDSSGNPTTCWYPVPGAGACAAYPDDTLFIFADGVASAAAALDLGAGPAHGQSRYFAITVQLPTNADPRLQGQQAVFSLAWHATT